MNDRNLSLSLAFIASWPDAAARTLERHDLESVAYFIASLPQSYTEQLLPRMLPRYLGSLFQYMDKKEISRLLKEQDLSFIAAVLRHLDPQSRKVVLENLSPKQRAGCNLLLSFTPDTVGAWQTPAAATVPVDCTVEEALHLVKVTGEDTQSDYVFAVGRDRLLRGRIRNLDLLRADSGQEIAVLMETGVNTLPGRLSLPRAAEHHDWATVDVMPVINRRNQFIGIIRHVDLRKGLDQLEDSGDTGNNAEAIGGLFGVYGDSMLALFNTLGDVFDPTSRKKGAD